LVAHETCAHDAYILRPKTLTSSRCNCPAWNVAVGESFRAEGPAVLPAQGNALGSSNRLKSRRPNGPTVRPRAGLRWSRKPASPGDPPENGWPVGPVHVQCDSSHPGRCPGLGERLPLRGDAAMHLESVRVTSFVGCDKLAGIRVVFAQDTAASSGTSETGLDAFAGMRAAIWCAGACRNVGQQGNAASASLSHTTALALGAGLRPRPRVDCGSPRSRGPAVSPWNPTDSPCESAWPLGWKNSWAFGPDEPSNGSALLQAASISRFTPRRRPIECSWKGASKPHGRRRLVPPVDDASVRLRIPARHPLHFT
jgi:hypothetical protein